MGNYIMGKTDRIIWTMGSLGVCVSVLENAWTAHSRMKFDEKDRVALNNAVHIQMLNGIGLCLLASRPAAGIPKLVPASLLFTGSVLFPGMIFYSRIFDDKRFTKLVMVGGSSSVLAWFVMMF